MDGRPSCVGHRHGERTRAVVGPDVSVADGRWHTVRCRKDDGFAAIVWTARSGVAEAGGSGDGA